MPGFAFPQVGPLGLGSPPSRLRRLSPQPSVLCSAKTASAHLKALRSSLVPRYSARFPYFVFRLRLVRRRGNSPPTPGLLFRRHPSSSGSREQRNSWLSQVPELPPYAHAPFFDPGGIHPPPPLGECIAAFRALYAVGLTTIHLFRGSIARPARSGIPAPHSHYWVCTREFLLSCRWALDR
jgi:hypothetical protein